MQFSFVGWVGCLVITSHYAQHHWMVSFFGIGHVSRLIELHSYFVGTVDEAIHTIRFFAIATVRIHLDCLHSLFP